MLCHTFMIIVGVCAVHRKTILLTYMQVCLPLIETFVLVLLERAHKQFTHSLAEVAATLG